MKYLRYLYILLDKLKGKIIGVVVFYMLSHKRIIGFLAFLSLDIALFLTMFILPNDVVIPTELISSIQFICIACILGTSAEKFSIMQK